MEAFMKSLPLLVFLGIMVFILFRMSRSMRLQREAVDRQKDGMTRVDESLKKQEEGLALSRESMDIAKAGAEVQRQMLDEIRQIRALLAKDR